ncbi:hypothetical protein FACS1894137_00080 [Spirochaetia bacterium]|nr:hypothetical protein FACS1894137_00080 [Spirochaetia bacterium]
MSYPRNRLLCTIVLVLAPLAMIPVVPLYPQVDTGELADGQEPIDFVNYEGPNTRIETRAQIRNIGYTLGTAVRGGAANTGTTPRYFVIHSVGGPDGDKIDADILGLGPQAGVDHIRNLRLIIQGYLEGAYAYGEQDAALLAQYITIYNAVFRGNWDFFNAKYKTPVIANLTREKAGLATRYDQWPGQTLIVIPLQTAIPGSISAIDTSTLTKGEVIDELRKDSDRGLPQRQDMVDLKEREAEAAEQKAAEQRQAIAQEEAAIAAERRQNAEEQQRIEEERRQAQEDQAAGRLSDEEAAEKEEALAAREAETAEKDEELAQREDNLGEQREAAEQSETLAEQKAAEAQQERQTIAADQQGLINQDAAPAPSGILGMRLETRDGGLGRLVRVDTGTGAELRRSAANTINARTLTVVNGKVLAVAGENNAIRIVTINPNTLAIDLQGDDNIHPQSLLWVKGADLYAITATNEGIFLGRYNTDLVRQARSAVAVHPFAAVTFQDDLLITQSTDGQAVLLNARDLTKKE